MKSIVVSILALTLVCHTGFAQEKKSYFVSLGTPFYAGLDGPVLNSPSLGFDFGVMRQISSRYYGGIDFDYVKASGIKPIDIPNNGIDNEKIQSSLKIISLRVINHFNLLPNRFATQLFIDTKVGFRVAKFKNEHDGYKNGLKKSYETIYENDNEGLSGEIVLGVYIPFIKSDPTYLGVQMKSGITTGSNVKYIDKNSVYYVNSTFTHGPVLQSNGTFLINTITLVWRAGKMKK